MRGVVKWIALGVLLLTGCDGETVQGVTGTIRLNGKPLPDGKVYFVPADGAPPVVADVNAGVFELKARSGSYRVEVRMFRDRVPWPGEPHDKQMNVIPARFNSETTLNAEVKKGEANHFTFAVEAR